MKVVIQRCSNASCKVDGKITGKIDEGLMILVGFCEDDNTETLKYMAKKIVNLRIFPDENNIMNKSVLDIGGSILSISQFTLYADTKKGNRPSYINSMSGSEAIKLYDLFNEKLRKYINVSTGVFGADMKVNIINDGPTTILLESRNKND